MKINTNLIQRVGLLIVLLALILSTSSCNSYEDFETTKTPNELVLELNDSGTPVGYYLAKDPKYSNRLYIVEALSGEAVYEITPHADPGFVGFLIIIGVMSFVAFLVALTEI